MPLIEPGRKAPSFALVDQNGVTHKLSEYAGRPVVLYFYPKDDTPGCTQESCDFRDALPRFKKSKAVVLGVSILDEKSKAKFAAKYDLTFPLLAGEDALRPHVHGHCAYDVSHRRRRQGGAALG
jgi:peroxiredoxin Q/BCP